MANGVEQRIIALCASPPSGLLAPSSPLPGVVLLIIGCRFEPYPRSKLLTSAVAGESRMSWRSGRLGLEGGSSALPPTFASGHQLRPLVLLLPLDEMIDYVAGVSADGEQRC